MSSQAIADSCVPGTKQSVRLPARNLLLTFALTILALAGSGVLWGSLGYQILIVAMGWPHIILGFMFYFGRVLRGEWRARSTFALLFVCTLALWLAHYAYVITGFIAVYFTYHVFRDEVFIYFQTRSRHQLRNSVAVAGFIPFIILMFLITDPRPQHYRQDLRRVDFTDVAFAREGWTLISFEPVTYSRGKQFYFYLQTPNSDAVQQYTTRATVEDSNSGEIRISDRPWKNAADLVFRTHYFGELSQPSLDARPTIAISLNGGHRVGQTFTATETNLDGIWLYTSLVNSAAEHANYTFHLTTDTSVPWAPLSPALNEVRFVLIIGLLLVVLWKTLPQWREHHLFWSYFLVLVAIFAGLQRVLRIGEAHGFLTPVMFQLVVVFHYWSWYVFSIDKLRATSRTSDFNRGQSEREQSIYDRMIGWFGSLSRFIGLVIALNLICAAGVLWYAKLHGPAPLRFVFDYSYFLYFLVLHVTFSLAPRRKKPVAALVHQT